jgi:hypothetical protein
MLSSRQSLWTERRRRRGRHVVDEPADDLGRRGDVLRARALPAVGPALHLPLEVAFGLAERLEARRCRVDGVEGGERVDDGLGELPVGDGIRPAAERGRDFAPDHRTAPALHHEERRADDRAVVAVDEGARRLGEGAVEDGEDAILAAPCRARSPAGRPAAAGGARSRRRRDSGGGK